MHRFETLDDVLGSIQKLMDRQPPLARVLPRQPGTKESRYAQLLGGNLEAWDSVASASAEDAPRVSSTGVGEIARLEQEIAGLRAELASLREEVAEFKKRFE